MSERIAIKTCAADGSYLNRPLHGDVLTEVFGSIRFTTAEGAMIRKLSAQSGLTFGQVIRKYCVLALPKP